MEIIDKYLAEHRSFLDKGYEKKILLTSGPKNPRDGGILLARSKTLEELKSFCSEDPFFQSKCAEYSFLEFIPVKFQREFSDWFIPDPI